MNDKVINEQTQQTALGLKNKFSFVDRLMGRGNKKTAEKETTEKEAVKEEKVSATKIKPLEQGNQMVDTLMQIYEFLKTTSDERKLNHELMNNMAEANKMAADKRHKELIDALKGLKGGKEDVTAEKVVDEAGGVFGILGDILNSFGGAKTALSILNSVGKFFLSPVGAYLLASGVLLTMLARDENAEETNKGLQTAMGGPAAEAQVITETVKNTTPIERRRANILADRPWSKKSMLFWKDKELQDKYLEEIGWDNDTGTTKEERDKGFIAIDEKGNLIKAPTESKPKETAPPPEAPKPAATPESAAPASPSAALNKAVEQNNDLKLPSSEESVPTINNVVASTTAQKAEALQRNPIPAVRNLEETFQRMIYYSTRVV